MQQKVFPAWLGNFAQFQNRGYPVLQQTFKNKKSKKQTPGKTKRQKNKLRSELNGRFAGAKNKSRIKARLAGYSEYTSEKIPSNTTNLYCLFLK